MIPKKDYTPGNVLKNLWIAVGAVNKYPLELQEHVSGWEFFFMLRPKPQVYNRKLMHYYGHTKKTIKAGFEELRATTERMFADALKDRDGAKLRLLADLVEERPHLSDSNRLWLLALCFDWSPPWKQKSFFTCRELVAMAKERRGWTISERGMLEICIQLGIKLSKAKEGRPPKTRKH